MGYDRDPAEERMGVVKRAIDDPAESVAPAGDDGDAESLRIAVDRLGISENETYRVRRTSWPAGQGVRDAFDIEDDDVPDFSTNCVRYQSLVAEVRRLLLRQS